VRYVLVKFSVVVVVVVTVVTIVVFSHLFVFIFDLGGVVLRKVINGKE